MAEQKKKLKDVLQAIYNAVKALVVQPDYAQNDSQQPDFIKNRTHYIESVSTSDVWYQSNVEVGSGTSSPGAYSGTFNLTEGKTYNVTITQGSNTKTYEGIVAENNTTLSGMLLNKNWSDPTGTAQVSSDAFYILVQASSVILASVDVYGSGCTVQVSEVTETIHKLDPKYLPDNVNQLESITTQESSVSGGTNVVTFTQSNGTQTSFNVKNGEKGDTGATGNVTVTDGVAQISIINDLTTGGSGDALSAEMGKNIKSLLDSITLAQGQDDKVYIAVGGVVQGNGFNPDTGQVEEPTVWASVVTDVDSLVIDYNGTAQLGVRLSERPSQSQTVTITCDSPYLSFSSVTLVFTKNNWNNYQYVTVTNTYNDLGNINITITLTNSDPLMTSMGLYVEAKGINYEDLVDTTIPSGAHIAEASEFTHIVSGNRIILQKYNGTYTNVYVPNAMTENGTTYSIVSLATGKTFINNTSIQYVEIADGVKANEYGSNAIDVKWTSLFNGCTSLIGVKYDGSDITELNSAFSGCTSLKFFDGLDRQVNLTNIYMAFNGCSSLVYVQDLSLLTKLSNLQQTFTSCTNLLRVLGMPKALTGTGVTANQLYSYCSKLSFAEIPNGVSDLFYACRGASSLRTLNVYAEATFTRITSAFSGCTNLNVYCVENSDAYTQLHNAYASSTDVHVLPFGGSALPSIVVWGDSTSSPNTSWLEWPKRLQAKIGLTLEVKNQAVSGEYTTSTSARQGGNAIHVGAFTIPSTTDATPIVMTTVDGQTFSTNPVFSGGGSFNPCAIEGVTGSISGNGGVYTFKRLEAGTSVSVAANSLAVSKQDGQFNNSEATMLVLLGCNSGWNDNPSTLLNQVNLMVQHFEAAGGTQYIIAGIFSGKHMREQAVRDLVMAYESLAATQFGNHWLNIREYLITNGLTQNGLTPSQSDTERMAVGQVPGSLLGGGTPTNIVMYPTTSSDDTHPNAYGANSIMLGFFEKGVALGYWNDVNE